MVDRRLCAWVWNRSPDLGLQAAVVPYESVAGRGRSRRDIAVVGKGRAKPSSVYRSGLAAWGVSKAPVVIGSLVFSEGMMTADGPPGESDHFRSPITYP
jgi:hypothetical protein